MGEILAYHAFGAANVSTSDFYLPLSLREETRNHTASQETEMNCQHGSHVATSGALLNIWPLKRKSPYEKVLVLVADFVLLQMESNLMRCHQRHLFTRD
ncbi:MAG: hypothetical protein ACLTEE_16100 [Anaerobutyricum hallii]